MAHADEAGLRVAGASQLTVYAIPVIHAKRGAEGLKRIGLLSGFRGILVDDQWRAYISTPAQHVSSNANRLRELIAEGDPPYSLSRSV